MGSIKTIKTVGISLMFVGQIQTTLKYSNIHSLKCTLRDSLRR